MIKGTATTNEELHEISKTVEKVDRSQLSLKDGYRPNFSKTPQKPVEEKEPVKLEEEQTMDLDIAEDSDDLDISDIPEY